MNNNTWKSAYNQAKNQNTKGPAQKGFGNYPQQQTGFSYPRQSGFSQQQGFYQQPAWKQNYSYFGQQSYQQYAQPKKDEFTGKGQMPSAPSYGYAVYQQAVSSWATEGVQQLQMYNALQYQMVPNNTLLVQQQRQNTTVATDCLSDEQLMAQIEAQQRHMDAWRRGEEYLDFYWAFRPFALNK